MSPGCCSTHPPLRRVSVPPDPLTLHGQRVRNRSGLVIPGMSGSQLASLIHRNHPSTAILYASGYSAEYVDSVAVGPQAPLLEKPYSLEQLAARVRAVLDARSEAIR